MAASLAATAVGTGISYYGQQQQAENAQAIANYNAAVQQQNAQIQARLAQQQATWQQQATMAQYQAQMNNAATLENQAQANEARGRVEADRKRQEADQVVARQKAILASSNVQIGTGTPLLTLVDTAKNLELGIQDVAYRTDLESRQLRQKAADERFQAGGSLMDASLQAYQASTIDISRQIAEHQATLTRLQGAASAEGYRTEAGATLLSGAAKITSTAFDDYYRLPNLFRAGGSGKATS